MYGLLAKLTPGGNLKFAHLICKYSYCNLEKWKAWFLSSNSSWACTPAKFL